MTLSVSYPYDWRSHEPRALSAAQIWLVAEQVRSHLVRRRPGLRVELDRIAATRAMLVNGAEIGVNWNSARRVQDACGRDALGLTEADPAKGNTVLISLNSGLFAERDYLRRSTIAQELGHALFDGPSMVRKSGGPALATVTPDENHLETTRRSPDGVMDRREYRANEFMGALLVPRSLLHRETVNRAIALGMKLHDAGGSLPVLRAPPDPMRSEELLCELGARFGVSPSFIEVRLKRYALVQ